MTKHRRTWLRNLGDENDIVTVLSRGFCYCRTPCSRHSRLYTLLQAIVSGLQDYKPLVNLGIQLAGLRIPLDNTVANEVIRLRPGFDAISQFQRY